MTIETISEQQFAQIAEQIDIQRPNDQDSRRLFHGRGHCFEGLHYLSIDFFQPLVLITLYKALDADCLSQLVNLLSQKLALADLSIAVQHRHQAQAPVEMVLGVAPEQLWAREGGLQYQLEIMLNQNNGFFLDMYHGRNWLQNQAQGKRVLNLFSYTCAFSMVAAMSGAKHIVNIDKSKAAIAVGQRNHNKNNQLYPNVDSQVTFLPYDIFRSQGKLTKLAPYDIVIADPPSFQKGSFEIERDYGRLLRKVSKWLAPDAYLLATLNSPFYSFDYLLDLVAKRCPNLEFVERLSNQDRFPEQQPQRGLKVAIWQNKDAPQ